MAFSIGRRRAKARPFQLIRGGTRRGFKVSTRATRVTRMPRIVRGFTRSAGFFGRFSKGGELKFHDIDMDDAVIAGGMNVQAIINAIPQGTTEVQRIGRKCTIRSIGWRFACTLPNSTTSANTSDVVRVMMILDKQCNGALPANTDIVESSDYQSFNNLGNKNRFRTLFDKTYDLTTSAGGGDGTTEDYGEDILTDSFFKRVNIPIEFDSTTGAITEIRSNNIIVMLGSRSGLAGFDSKIRLRFSDN